VATVRLTATTLPVDFLAADASGVGAAGVATGAATAPQAGSQQPLPAPQPGSQQPLPAEQSGSPQQLSQHER